jgi:GntR family transcriptional regulator, transcriptional repressor for pyruvate dehydrogenase complex
MDSMSTSGNGLPAQVAQQLLDRIMAQEIPPGAVLPSERELVETYAVSRPVAREAIKLLAARGIIIIHPRQGATVALDLTGAAREALLLAFQKERVVRGDLLEVRMVLEPEIAARAAHSTAPTHMRRLRELRHLLDELLIALSAGHHDRVTEIWGRSDPQLHILLAEMSHNPIYKVLIEVINDILWRQQQQSVPKMTDEHLLNAATQHAAICDAVLAGDAEGARRAMIVHLDYTHSHIFGKGRELTHTPTALPPN